MKIVTKTQETTTYYTFDNGWKATQNHKGQLRITNKEGVPITETSITWCNEETIAEYIKIVELIEKHLIPIDTNKKENR
jgi:hypothetical protein